AWFAGYTPDLASVVAVMGQNPDTGAQTPLYGALGLPRVNGGGVPAETWAAYTEAALRSSPVQEFDLQTAPGSDEGDELLVDENADGGTDPSSSSAPDTSPDASPDATPGTTPDGSAPPTPGTNTGGTDEGSVSAPDGDGDG
ncbi:penicillin-binding protein, partial [Streptomyces sp. SID4931]